MTIEMVKGVERFRCEHCKKLIGKDKKPYRFVDVDSVVHDFCNQNQFVKWYDSKYQLKLFTWGAMQKVVTD